jgi:peptide/nickel transport system ATP-binding protein
MARYPFELSGGMRQRVMIALAFSCEPELIIADEPTTALDVTVQLQVLRLLKHKARASGTSVLFISHDMAVVSQLCDRMYVMYAGSVIESGTTQTLIHHPVHPYSIGLLQCAPENGQPRDLLPAIPGTVPNLSQLPQGCAFRERCFAAGAKCSETPRLTPNGAEGQQAACWYPQREKPMSDVLLELDSVHVNFAARKNWLGRVTEQVHALNGLDLQIRRGETLGIVGESGCGKSTLAQLLMGMLKPTGACQRRTHAGGMQMVFQDPLSSLDPRLPVWRIITEPVWVQKRSSDANAASWRKPGAAGGHSPGISRPASARLSGGQRQRIAIARALSSDPDIIVLDEPTSALDISVQAQILNLLVTLQQQRNLTYVLISHNVSVVRHMSDRVAVMYLGQIVELGSAAQVLGEPRHPYTRLLLDSVPAPVNRWMKALRKTELPGNRRLPEGCFSATVARWPRRVRTSSAPLPSTRGP